VETTTHALAADITFAGTHAERLAGDVEWLRDVARVGLAAGQLGNTDEGVREAASYLSGREQFGRPLATFQAVSQQLGDAYCDVQAMRATLWQAVWALDRGSGDQGSAQQEGAARRAVDVAAWWACDAGVRVQTVVQHLHGGIGADVTYPVHRRLLWALHTDALLGGASRQLARLGPALL
jgi:acyl-CoA dehydrogenase